MAYGSPQEVDTVIVGKASLSFPMPTNPLIAIKSKQRLIGRANGFYLYFMQEMAPPH